MREANVIDLSDEPIPLVPVGPGGRGATRAAAATRDRTFHADHGHVPV